MYSAEPLPHFVDEYLVVPVRSPPHQRHLRRRPPARRPARGLEPSGDRRRRSATSAASRAGWRPSIPARLTDVERLERPALDASIRARLFELEEVRTWERSPQHYADILATSLAGQALFDYAPLAERARRVAVEAAPGAAPHPGGARQHQGSARHLREGRPREHARHAALHRRGPAARLRRSRATCTSSAISPTRRPRRPPRSARYIEYLERDLAPRSKGSFRLGRERFEQKLRLDEGHRRSTPTGCSRSRLRELQQTQEEFRRVASRMNGGDPLAAWAKAKDDHPPAGQLVPVAQQQLAELVDFINRAADRHDPEGRAGRSRADAAVLSLDVRQHVDARPVRGAAAPRLLLHHRRRSVVAGRAPGRAPARLQLRRALVDLDPRGVPRPLPPLPAPAPGRRRSCASRSCSRRRRSSKAGRTTASR